MWGSTDVASRILHLRGWGAQQTVPSQPFYRNAKTHWYPLAGCMGPTASPDALMKKRSLNRAENIISIPRSSNSQPGHYTDWAISTSWPNEVFLLIGLLSIYYILDGNMRLVNTKFCLTEQIFNPTFRVTKHVFILKCEYESNVWRHVDWYN